MLRGAEGSGREKKVGW